MHYANGREAKNLDRVMRITPENCYDKPIIGILYDYVAGSDACNGNLVSPLIGEAVCNLSECLHVDDVQAAIGDRRTVKDTSKK